MARNLTWFLGDKRSKEEGLNVLNINNFNGALSSKWWLKIISHPRGAIQSLIWPEDRHVESQIPQLFQRL